MGNKWHAGSGMLAFIIGLLVAVVWKLGTIMDLLTEILESLP